MKQMEINIQNRLVEKNLKKCKSVLIKSFLNLEEPEWKMKKFQNIAPKVSEHIHRE